MHVPDFRTLAFFFLLFAPRLHHKNFADCRSLAGYRVHFYRKTALGTLFFRGYQEQFHYVFALGLLLLEKLRMSAKTYEFDYIRVFIEPDLQGIAFYVALHAIFIFA